MSQFKFEIDKQDTLLLKLNKVEKNSICFYSSTQLNLSKLLSKVSNEFKCTNRYLFMVYLNLNIINKNLEIKVNKTCFFVFLLIIKLHLLS